MSPRRIITGALLGATLAAAPCASPPAPVNRATRCMEDSACWNWATMGNHKRGIATADGARNVVVGPCRFARLMHGNYIDWTHTHRLRGDWTAYTHPHCASYRPVQDSDIY